MSIFFKLTTFLLFLLFFAKGVFLMLEIETLNGNGNECEHYVLLEDEGRLYEIDSILEQHLAIRMKPDSPAQDPVYRLLSRGYVLTLDNLEKKRLFCELFNE